MEEKEYRERGKVLLRNRLLIVKFLEDTLTAQRNYARWLSDHYEIKGLELNALYCEVNLGKRLVDQEGGNEEQRKS